MNDKVYLTHHNKSCNIVVTTSLQLENKANRPNTSFLLSFDGLFVKRSLSVSKFNEVLFTFDIYFRVFTVCLDLPLIQSH